MNYPGSEKNASNTLALLEGVVLQNDQQKSVEEGGKLVIIRKLGRVSGKQTMRTEIK